MSNSDTHRGLPSGCPSCSNPLRGSKLYPMAACVKTTGHEHPGREVEAAPQEGGGSGHTRSQGKRPALERNGSGGLSLTEWEGPTRPDPVDHACSHEPCRGVDHHRASGGDEAFPAECDSASTDSETGRNRHHEEAKEGIGRGGKSGLRPPKPLRGS